MFEKELEKAIQDMVSKDLKDKDSKDKDKNIKINFVDEDINKTINKSIDSFSNAIKKI